MPLERGHDATKTLLALTALIVLDLRPAAWASDDHAVHDGREERIRTSGPCLPKTVLYQAELLPDGVRSLRPWGTDR